MREVTITANDAGQRLDRFLKKYLCNAPLSLVYKAVRKDVKVNGKRAKEETLLAEGDVLQLYLSDTDLDALILSVLKYLLFFHFAHGLDLLGYG